MRIRLLFLSVLLVAGLSSLLAETQERPRVVVTTDINIRQGDPDDRQSLIHLLWYLDELDVKVIVADRSCEEPRTTGALTACHMAVDAYTTDYYDPRTRLAALKYPHPDAVQRLIQGGGDEEGVRALVEEARRPDHRPLWVLVWGNMKVLRNALRRAPDIAPVLRVISIGTFHNHRDRQPYAGANSAGRDDIFNDPRFTRMWWIEDNNIGGMFAGVQYAPEDPRPSYDWAPIGGAPRSFIQEIAQYGALGRHMIEATEGNEWAQYFRAGDTPSVLYLLDHQHDPLQPEQASWAGEFERPWPQERPNHWANSARGQLAYDEKKVEPSRRARIESDSTDRFVARRPEIYDAIRRKLRALYPSVVVRPSMSLP